jgi:hypothetical protein
LISVETGLVINELTISGNGADKALFAAWY